MKHLLTLSICLLVLVVQAQSFQELIKNGDHLYDEEKYLESAKEYDKAFEIKEGSADQYYNAACSWALTGDTVQSINYLILSSDKGWRSVKHMKRDKDLGVLHTAKDWTEVLKKVQANLDEYEKDFDKPLKKRLEQIYIRDQTLRQLYGDVEEKFGRESEEMTYFWNLISEQDSLNEIETLEIIENRGWVGTSLVGSQANTTLWLVIQHAALEAQEVYLPLLKESVLKGESKGNHLALLEDRIQMKKGKPQTYGSQVTRDKETGVRVVYEIRDPEYVNQRRKEVGLGPIQDYVKRWGIKWTTKQKEK